MTLQLDRPTAEEVYLSARSTTHLGHFAERPCAADKLLAAAYAARGSERKMLALEVWGVLATTDLRGARGVAEKMAGWVRRTSLKERGGEPLTRVQAFDLVLRLMKLWHRRTCLSCNGHGHPMREDSPVLDETRDCPDCRGTGLIPIERMVKPEHVKAARAIESEINALCSIVFKDMADILAGRMSLTK